MSDSRKPDVVLNSLEVEEVGPFVVALSGNKRITFPDPGQLQAFEAEEFASDLVNAPSAKTVFEKWLSSEDFTKIQEEKGFTLYKMNALVKKLQSHYEAVFGGPGEGIAS